MIFVKPIATTVILSFLLTVFAAATIQSRDILIVRGKRIYTYEMPGLEKAFPDQKVPKFNVISTANYKGYNATWAVMGGQLYLVGLEGLVREEGKMLWDEKVLKGLTFPVKVEQWSGEVKQSNSVSVYDPNTNEMKKFVEQTTIVFKQGKVIRAEFDKRVPVKKLE